MLCGRPADNREIVRIGAAATLSRNFQYTLLRPLLASPCGLVLRSGFNVRVFDTVDSHALDMLLSNMPVPPRDAGQNRHSHLLADVAVSLVSRRSRGRRPFRFPDDLATTPVLLLQPRQRDAYGIRSRGATAGITPRIIAEVDDGYVAPAGAGCAGRHAGPHCGGRDELAAGTLVERRCPVCANALCDHHRSALSKPVGHNWSAGSQ